MFLYEILIQITLLCYVNLYYIMISYATLYHNLLQLLLCQFCCMMLTCYVDINGEVRVVMLCRAMLFRARL